MHAARFAVFALVMLGVLLLAIMIEHYRMCRKQGYTDCPRTGGTMWRRAHQN
jgi:hypothetical protein